MHRDCLSHKRLYTRVRIRLALIVTSFGNQEFGGKIVCRVQNKIIVLDDSRSIGSG